MPTSECSLIKLPQFLDSRGELTCAEYKNHIPFEIRRVYFINNVPKGASRAGHAHKTLQQVIIPISGSFDVHLDDGHSQKSLHLDSNSLALYICPMVWKLLDNFSADATCLILASNLYDPVDYYHDYSEFMRDIVKVG